MKSMIHAIRIWWKGSPVTANASGRSFTIAAKAVSNSTRGLTLTGMTVTPNVGAAACISSSWRTLEALSGLKRKATRETVGMTSLRICSRLAPTSGPRIVLPVIFPPGRARLGTSPARTGSPIEIMTMGTVVVACLAAKLAGVPKVAITSTGRRTSAAAASASRSVAIRIVEGDVLAFEVTEIAQPVTEGVPVERVVDYADARDLPRLLRARRERPADCCAAERG